MSQIGLGCRNSDCFIRGKYRNHLQTVIGIIIVLIAATNTNATAATCTGDGTTDPNTATAADNASTTAATSNHSSSCTTAGQYCDSLPIPRKLLLERDLVLLECLIFKEILKTNLSKYHTEAQQELV